MSLWTAQEAALATGGQATTQWSASGVSIDTRSLEPGDLFVALTAARDGHDFVAGALAKGAAAALVSRIPEGVPADAPLLIVEDVLTGLEALGRAARARTAARVVAVTGSVGKTSTKEMLRHVLMAQGRTHAAEASYNNHWGVPLTLARMPQDTEFAVIEIGMNHPGEIAPLARLARPHVAIVTTVAPVHLEAFDDGIEGIACEKASIFEGLEPGGIAVLNRDVETAPILTAIAALHAEQTVGFGQANADYTLTGIAVDRGESHVTAHGPSGELSFTVLSLGQHFAVNALSVLAAVDALGADLGRAAQDMGGWRPFRGRGVLEKIETGDANSAILLIDEAYNANPTSLGAALDVLAATPATGRRIAFVGDMKELGPQEVAMHADMARHDALASIDVVHCVGPLMQALHTALPDAKRGLHAQTSQDLVPRVPDCVAPGDVVMVKGSLSMAMAQIVDAIRKLGHGTSETAKKDV